MLFAHFDKGVRALGMSLENGSVGLISHFDWGVPALATSLEKGSGGALFSHFDRGVPPFLFAETFGALGVEEP